MSDDYLLENGTDRFLLEDGSGVLLLEQQEGEVTDAPMPYVSGGYYPTEG